MKKSLPALRRGRRGITTLAFFVAAMTMAAGGVALLWPSSAGPKGPSDLDRAKTAYADRQFALAEQLLDGYSCAEADILRAKIRRETGKLAEARDLFAKVFKADPQSVVAVQGLAQVYSALRQDELAIPFWRKLTDLKPTDAYAWRELALAQVRTKDSMGALSSIQKSLELDPNQQDLNTLLAEVATGKLDFETPTTAEKRSYGSARTPNVPDPNRYFPQPHWRNK